MTTTELDEFLSRWPQTRYLDVFYCDLSCVIRGKRYPVEQAAKVFRSGMMTPGSSFLLAVTGESTGPEGLGFDDGDPDELGMPVPGTLAPVPWAQVPTAQVMLSLQGLDGTPYYYEPRNVLIRVVEKFRELGLVPMVAFEPEFYLLDTGRDAAGKIRPPRSPLTGQPLDTAQVYSLDDVEEFGKFLDEVVSTCTLQGLSAGAISGEYAPGQFEINLQHTDDPVAAADHCVLFRRALQGTARRHGLRGTFMAKPYPGEAGSGLHLHISLLDSAGENAFDGGGEYGAPACGSPRLFHAIGGLLGGMADSMGIFVPNTNAFRRFEPDVFVPVRAAWGYENRSVAVRIPKSPGAARRIEHRVAGADANPYLVLAAILAAMHDGITRAVDPGEPATGNASVEPDPDLPLALEDAMARTRQSALLHRYLGERYIRAYTSCKLGEYGEFTRTGDDETRWYL